MFTRWGFTTVFNLASTMASANTIRDRLGGVTGPEVLTVGAPFCPPGGAPVYARPIYTAAHLPSAEITTQEAAVARVSKVRRNCFRHGCAARGPRPRAASAPGPAPL